MGELQEIIIAVLVAIIGSSALSSYITIRLNKDKMLAEVRKIYRECEKIEEEKRRITIENEAERYKIYEEKLELLENEKVSLSSKVQHLEKQLNELKDVKRENTELEQTVENLRKRVFALEDKLEKVYAKIIEFTEGKATKEELLNIIRE